MKRVTTIKWLLALLAAASLVFGLRLRAESSEGEWVRVARRDLVFEVSVTGELIAGRSGSYGPPALRRARQFKIAYMAPEGRELGVGEETIRFDTTELEEFLLQAEANRDAAQMRLEKQQQELEAERSRAELALAAAQAKLRRGELQEGIPPELVAGATLEQAIIDRQLAAEEIEYRQGILEHLGVRGYSQVERQRQERDRQTARVASLEREIEAMTVRAREPGTVIYHTNSRGEKKKVGERAWRGETLLEIPDLRSMKAEVQVEEVMSGRLSVGQVGTLRLDAYPDRTYRVRVGQIRRTVQARSWLNPQRVVWLELEFDENDPSRMRPGMRVEGRIEVDRVEDALVVPVVAVRATSTEPRVLSREIVGRRRWVAPELGRSNADWVEVLDGLEEGTLVQVGAGG